MDESERLILRMVRMFATYEQGCRRCRDAPQDDETEVAAAEGHLKRKRADFVAAVNAYVDSRIEAAIAQKAG